MPAITAEIAKEYAARSVATRQRAKAEREALTAGWTPETASDPLAVGIACACNETLAKLRTTPKATERAALARALRELRETWHMVTGESKPGQRRPGRERERASLPTRAPTPIVPKPQSDGPAPVSPRATVDTTSFDPGL